MLRCAQALAARLQTAMPQLGGVPWVEPAHTPGQPNDFDGGVCVLQAAEQLVRSWLQDGATLPDVLNADPFTAAALAAKRREILSQLATAKSRFA